MKQTEKERIASIIISEKLRNRSTLLPSVRLEMEGRLARSGEQALSLTYAITGIKRKKEGG